LRVSLALAIVTCFFSVNAFGFISGEIHYKWWKNPRIKEEMELTDKQVESIEEIFTSYREQIILFQRELKREEAELLTVLRKPECSRDEVMEITDHIEDMKATLTRIKVEMYLKIKNVLTTEQVKTLHNIKDRYRGRSR
jgi:Spy/CpxP family protein refolding chaperone